MERGHRLSTRVWAHRFVRRAGGRKKRPGLGTASIISIIGLVSIVSMMPLVECIRADRLYDDSESSQVEALRGANLTLRCPFSLESTDQLYSIKWHKKLNGTFAEFYSVSKQMCSALFTLLLTTLSSSEEVVTSSSGPAISIDISTASSSSIARANKRAGDSVHQVESLCSRLIDGISLSRENSINSANQCGSTSLASIISFIDACLTGRTD